MLRRDGPVGAVITADQLPTILVDVAVVNPAKVDQVLEICRTVFGPVLDVMAIGPVNRTIAARKGAATVPDIDNELRALYSLTNLHD